MISIKRKKSVFSRLAATLFAAFMMTILCSFCAISASAAEVDAAAESVAAAAASDEIGTVNAAQLLIPTAPAVSVPFANTFIAAAAGAAGGGAAATGADASFQQVITFFTTWIRRIGMVIAFVGAVMFALAIKNNDAEQKQQALLTMIAGFVVATLVTVVGMFDMFT